MTRKQALHKAIEALSSTPGNEDAVETLSKLINALPLVHWNDEAIRDAVQQYVEDHGKPPRASDFKKPGLPPLTAINTIYGTTAQTWLDENFPVAKPDLSAMKKRQTELFIKEYYIIKPRSPEQFNAERCSGVRGWMTIAKYNNVSGWRNLLSHLGLPKYFDMRKDHVPTNFQVEISHDYDFQD